MNMITEILTKVKYINLKILNLNIPILRTPGITIPNENLVTSRRSQTIGRRPTIRMTDIDVMVLASMSH